MFIKEYFLNFIEVKSNIDGKDNKDIEAIDLFQETLIVQEMVDENVTSLQTLSLLN